MLYLDLETYSDLDIKKVSLDRYASHPSTRILMCAYAEDTGPVQLWQEGEDKGGLPGRLTLETLVAWNVGFERNLLRRVWGLTGLSFRDAMVDALYAGLPAGLKDCNRVPFFANDAETSKETLLINKFCKPSKNGVKHDRTTDPEDWAKFCQYCRDDVHDTRLIHQWLLKHFKTPERVLKAWHLDQKINERGMPVDRSMTYWANQEAERLQEVAFQDLKDLTGLENPNSVKQLLEWLTERGYPYTSLGKDVIKKALDEDPKDGEPLDDDE